MATARRLFRYHPYQYARELREREQLFQLAHTIERRYRLNNLHNPFHYYNDKEFQM